MNTYEPLVSIIIPVYNGANYMRQAIDSALAQTYENIEIIVVNDGSTDDGETEQIALSYGERIRYYKKENGGCASALNYGISKMKGDWFSWLSHDDLYMPDKVKSQINAIRNNRLDTRHTVICCGTQVIDENGDPAPHINEDQAGFVCANKMAEFMLGGHALNGCALLIPKAALDEMGPFNTEYVYILDIMYWINLSLAGYDFFFITDALSLNRKHGEQVSVKKKALLSQELSRFAWVVAQRVIDNADHARYAWVFCRANSCEQGCSLIQSRHKITFKYRLSAFRIRFIRKVKRIIKKILHMR